MSYEPYDPNQQPPQPQDYVQPEYIVVEEPRRKEGYWHKMGGGSLMVSIIVHSVIGVIALFLVMPSLMQKEDPPPDFLPGGGGGGGGAQNKIQQKRQRAVANASPRARLASSAVTQNAVVLPDVTSTLTPMTSLMGGALQSGGRGTGSGGGQGSGIGQGIGSGIGNGIGPGRGVGFVSLPKIMASRCSPAERAQKMLANGGGPECEEAVMKALRWLKTKQNPDGSWGSTHKGGMTGLALLSFLGHCELPDSPEFGENITKGITYLINLATNQKNEDFEGIFSEQPETIKSTYEHGIATYALGEVYSFAKLGSKPIPMLAEAFEHGVRIIIEKQAPSGGWAYANGIGYQPSGGGANHGGDLSVTGWQFQALKAAKHTNLKIRGLSSAVNQVEKYLEKNKNKGGGFGRDTEWNDEEHYSQWMLTGAAVLGLQTLGSGHADDVKDGCKFIEDMIEKHPLDWNSNGTLYSWYYNTQACFQRGGELWNKWNKQAKPLLIANQNPDGSWKADGSPPQFRAGTSAQAGGDANIYRTCLCTLMLEVYYRYLKVGDREDSPSGLRPVNK